MYKSKSYFECPPYPDGKYYKEWCVNFDKKICFITINKNAGSSIREGLKCHGFNNVLVDYQHLSSYLDALENFKFFSFVRDPHQRYVSGLAEFLFLYYKNYNEEYIENNLKENKFIFDHHTIPQSDNIINGTYIFKLDHNVSKTISYLINESVNIPILNSSKIKLNFSAQFDFCAKMHERYCLNNQAYMNLYQRDFEYVSSCGGI